MQNLLKNKLLKAEGLQNASLRIRYDFFSENLTFVAFSCNPMILFLLCRYESTTQRPSGGWFLTIAWQSPSSLSELPLGRGTATANVFRLRYSNEPFGPPMPPDESQTHRA